MEHRGDVSDQATAAEERFLAQALQAQKQAAKSAPTGFDGSHCTDCDAEIPEQRLRMGCFTCVECQTAIEKLNKLRRKS